MLWLTPIAAVALCAAPPQADDASRILERANSAYLAHSPLEAVALYREYLARNPDRADVRVFLGAALFSAGQPAEALEEATRALALDSGYGRAHVLVGRIYAQQEQWEPAQQAFAKALRIDTRDREAWYFSGRAWYVENRFEQAIEAFEKARSLGSGQSRIYENLGLSYEALGRFTEAEQSYRAAVSLAAEYRPYLAYGVFLYKQGRLEESLPMLRQALALDPQSFDTKFELGKALYQAGQFDQAARMLEEALLQSNQCRVHYLLVKVYSQLGRKAESDQHAAAANGCKNVP
jgi:tetratricopeptide (TPR) repeat protein